MKPALLLLCLAIFPLAASAQGTHSIKLLTPETALKAAQAALNKCRDNGYQATIAVVHTPRTARAKAYSAVSFRTNTTELAEATQAGRPQSGIRHLPGVAAVGGGLMIEAGGSLLGAIGVSGAPGGKEDDACAAAGIAAIREDIEF